MPQSTFSVRMDESVKKQFDNLCTSFGMTASTAFNIFARTVIRERKIPFAITADTDKYNLGTTVTLETGYNAFTALRNQAKDNGLQGMSLKEINTEIAAVRKESDGAS